MRHIAITPMNSGASKVNGTPSWIRHCRVRKSCMNPAKLISPKQEAILGPWRVMGHVRAFVTTRTPHPLLGCVYVVRHETGMAALALVALTTPAGASLFLRK